MLQNQATQMLAYSGMSVGKVMNEVLREILEIVQHKLPQKGKTINFTLHSEAHATDKAARIEKQRIFKTRRNHFRWEICMHSFYSSNLTGPASICVTLWKILLFILKGLRK